MAPERASVVICSPSAATVGTTRTRQTRMADRHPARRAPFLSRRQSPRRGSWSLFSSAAKERDVIQPCQQRPRRPGQRRPTGGTRASTASPGVGPRFCTALSPPNPGRRPRSVIDDCTGGRELGEYAQKGHYVRCSTVTWPVCKSLTATLLLGFWLWINFAAPIAVSIVSRQD